MVFSLEAAEKKEGDAKTAEKQSDRKVTIFTACWSACFSELPATDHWRTPNTS